MILKILTGSGCEIIDGFDRVSYCDFEAGRDRDIEGRDIGTRIDYYDFTEQQKSYVSDSNPKIELRLYKGSELINQVISHKPIYILNDNGKTVERI